MRKFHYLFLTLVLVALGTTTALAVPANPNPVEITQPDGTKITVQLKGDEKIKWAQTLDGYSILFNKEGIYEYAVKNEKGDLVPSGVKVKMPEDQTIEEKSLLNKLEKGLFYSKSQVELMHSIWSIKEKEGEKAFPTTGNRNLVCILVGFTDKAFTKTQSDFNNLFNQVGYTTGGATGSVKDYYLENSYTQFNLTVDVAGPYTLAQNMAYYGANDSYGNDVRPRTMVTEAVNLANASVNYANYDNDSDGYVDAVYVIFAGYGEEAYGPANAIWSHASGITPVYLDGKYVSRYSCSPELSGNSGTTITRIGVICHEFGHVLGAPDYYDTDYAESGGEFDGTGGWDLMAGGSWNNGGATPAHHNAYTKTYTYGWASVTTLSSPAIITLNNSVDNSDSFYRINTTTSNEFFLIENRYKHKFDASLPGSGMMIYHVHSGYASAAYNNIINIGHPLKMYPVSANATIDPTATITSYGTINSTSCPWPYSSKTSFTDATLPSSKSWAGANTAKPITNLTRNATAKTVTFYFMGGVIEWPTNFESTPISSSQIDLSWNKTNGKDVLLAYSLDGVFGTPSATNYVAGNAISGGGTVIYAGGNETFSHTDLDINVKYYYKIWSKLTSTPTWSLGQETNATTPCTIISEYPYSEIFDASITPTCWTIESTATAAYTWKPTTGYTVGTTTVSPVIGSNFFYCPWSLTQNQDEDLIIPVLDLTEMTNPRLSFWFNGSYTKSVINNKCDLKVLARVSGGEWTQLWIDNSHPQFTSAAVDFNWLKAYVDLSDYAGLNNVELAFNYFGKNGGNFGIDDISIQNWGNNVLTISINGQGEVEVNSVQYTAPVEFSEGEMVTISAIPTNRWMFEGWSGDFSSSNPSETLMMVSNKSINAVFAETYAINFSVSANSNPIEGATINIGAESLTTNAEGTASLNLPNGSYSYSVLAEGYSEFNDDFLVNSATQSVNVTLTPTSISTNSIYESQLYPNPFVEKLNLKVNFTIDKINVFSTTGQLVVSYSGTNGNEEQLDLTKLFSGPYIVSITGKNGQKINRMVVKK